MSSTFSLGFATFFAVGALVLIALAFGTDNWIDTYIDYKAQIPPITNKEEALRSRVYYSRHKGLFRECVYLSNATFLRHDSIRDKVMDNRCLLVEYEIPEKPGHIKYSDDYWAMIHLSRSVVAFFIVAMIMILAGAIFGAVACWKSTCKPAQVAGIFVFLGAFFAAGAMAFFHGAEYIEKNKLQKINPSDPTFYQALWDEAVKKETIRRYAWSYIIGWIGVGVSIISAILYLFTAWYIADKKREAELYSRYSTARSIRSTRPVVYYADDPGYVYAQPPQEDMVYVMNTNGKPVLATTGTLPPGGGGYIGPYENGTGKIGAADTWHYRY